MVHALREARRVLKPGCILIDLRPAISHRRVGIREGGSFRDLGIMDETFDKDRAANRAVSYALRTGFFKLEAVRKFDCNRVLDTADEFRDWLSEYVDFRSPAHERLIRKVEDAYKAARGRRRIVVNAPLVMRVLTNQRTKAGRRLTIR
jgi:SAM-dependent methyltransferase